MLGENWKGYYLTAYGIAVKHGFKGTEEEWLASLRGEAGAKAELRYDEGEETLLWRAEGEKEWKVLLPLSSLQGDVVSATLAEARRAEESAESANASAVKSAQAAAKSEENAMAAERKILGSIEEYGSIVSRAFVQGDILYIQTSNGKTFAAGNVRGRQGNVGDPGVYIGKEAPTDKKVRIWINPSEHETLDEVMRILNKLRYTDGGVEVDLSDYVKEDAVGDVLGNLGLFYVRANYVYDDDAGDYLTATIPGISELSPGVIARIIPDSDMIERAYIDVNGLGIKRIARHLSYDNGVKEYRGLNIIMDCPVELVYDGTDWMCVQLTKPSARDLEWSNGETLSPAHGGTGQSTVPNKYDILTGNSIGGFELTSLEELRHVMGAPRVIEGQYSGDGTEGRRISVDGFVTLLFVQKMTEGSPLWINTEFGARWKLDSAGVTACSDSCSVSGRGFKVSGEANESGVAYKYTVIEGVL